jgi:CDP-diacylglycerol---glycerol-3-phosphate 3-phosphatidyltransferase
VTPAEPVRHEPVRPEPARGSGLRREPHLRETVPPHAVREPLTASVRPRLTDDPIGDPVSSVSAWNIANALTVLRLLLVPVFVVTLFWHGGHDDTWRIVAWAVFAVAAITDRIDGEIARKRQIVTDFGKLADPIADKALAGAALIGLSVLGDLPWWITVVMLGREVGVTVLRFWVIRHGVIPASRGGKVKTLLQAVAIGLYVLPLSGWLHVVAAVLMYAAVVMAVATGVDYVARARRLRRGPRESSAPQVSSPTA